MFIMLSFTLHLTIDYLAPMLNSSSLSQLMETSDVVGNIRFTHPTLYIFPGGQGDAALFGINGFNMLGEYILERICENGCIIFTYLNSGWRF